jgi:hypothetical protein
MNVELIGGTDSCKVGYCCCRSAGLPISSRIASPTNSRTLSQLLRMPSESTRPTYRLWSSLGAPASSRAWHLGRPGRCSATSTNCIRSQRFPTGASAPHIPRQQPARTSRHAGGNTQAQPLHRQSRLCQQTRVRAGRDEIPARFYEGAAAGTVMIGEAPGTEEFKRQFDWPDAVIHMPFDSPDIGRIPADLQIASQA